MAAGNDARRGNITFAVVIGVFLSAYCFELLRGSGAGPTVEIDIENGIYKPNITDPKFQNIKEWYLGPYTGPLSNDQLEKFSTDVPLLEYDRTPWALERFSITRLVTSLALLLGTSLRIVDKPEIAALKFIEKAPQEIDLSYWQELASAQNEQGDIAYKTGELLFHGLVGVQDLKAAASYFQTGAELSHPDSQFMAGVASSTGLFGNVKIDQRRANLWYELSAGAGNPRAMMAAGFRHNHGIATWADNRQSLMYYRAAANWISKEFRERAKRPSLYSRGPTYAHVLTDDGILGNRKRTVRRLDEFALGINIFGSKFDSVEEGLASYESRAEEDEDLMALLLLSYFADAGVPGDEPDPDLALSYGKKLLNLATNNDFEDVTYTRAELDKFTAHAHGILGRAYFYGRGVPKDLNLALDHFQQGHILDKQIEGQLKNWWSLCSEGLALVYLELAQDHENDKAKYEALALEQLERKRYPVVYQVTGEWSPFYIYLANALVQKTGDLKQGLDISQKIGHYMGYALTANITRSINESRLKKAAASNELENRDALEEQENSDILKELDLVQNACYQAEDLHSNWRYAQRIYKGHFGVSSPARALVVYLVTAEMGYMAGQVAVSDLLDVRHSAISVPYFSKWPVPAYVLDRHTLALTYFVRAGSFGRHADSLSKAAEYFWRGIGCAPDRERAMQCILAMRRTIDWPYNAWIMGWMHEWGSGLDRDLHLAKRYYDEALQAPQPALAAYVSLYVVKVKLWYLWLTGSQ